VIGKGSLSSAPNRRVAISVLAHLTWLALLGLLVAWWGKLLMIQASKIAELEGELGLSADLTQKNWHRTQRMLYGESATFFALLLGCSTLLFWLYWRDVKRARGLQAFFASVTHELRTPLTSIRLQAESIADGAVSENVGLEGSTSKNLVARLLEDTIRLEAQVERTLELARVEGGGPVYTQPLQIKPWLDRFLKSWTADHRDRVDFDAQIEDVLIEADPTAMQVIFKNLLENAIRHSKRDRVRISISMATREKGISLKLKDDGAGYSGDEKTLGKVFQKGPSSQGTGVGLYLVKVLMKRMGGWVDFTTQSSSPGFEVDLRFLEGKTNG
jgi:signal transduction histidine kinase